VRFRRAEDYKRNILVMGYSVLFVQVGTHMFISALPFTILQSTFLVSWRTIPPKLPEGYHDTAFHDTVEKNET
jgi:hypothetical protein